MCMKIILSVMDIYLTLLKTKQIKRVSLNSRFVGQSLINLHAATSFMCRVASATENTGRDPLISVAGRLAGDHLLFK